MSFEQLNWVLYDPEKVSEEELRGLLSPLEPTTFRHYSPRSALVWVDAGLLECDRITKAVRALEDAWTDPNAERKEAERVARFQAYLKEQGLDRPIEIVIPGDEPYTFMSY